MATIALDIECYRNYFFALFKSTDGRVYTVRLFNNNLTGNLKQVMKILTSHTILTFNGTNYDLPMITGLLEGFNNRQLKDLSDNIIKSGQPWWQLRHDYSFRIPMVDHVDLVGVTPLQASLKTYGARIRTRKLQDLPIHPDSAVTDAQVPLLERYCENDVDVTIEIMRHMAPQLRLRVSIGEEYGFDARSMSDPQIAEAILRNELNGNVSKRDGQVEPFRYRVPEFIRFKSPELNATLAGIRSTVFHVEPSGYVKLPAHLEVPIEFGGAKYKMGIGGLHSQEKKQIVIPQPDELFGEFDVASMYPSIILGQKLYPKHLSKEFVDVYRSVFNRRIHAKNSGDKITADTLKIVLNASYGKFGSKYSFLYSPELLVQTTITGQLSLLMLIERFTNAGMPVKSANTDGVNVLMQRHQWELAETIAARWTNDTGYVLEWSEYASQYSRDVNSYIAFKPDGSIKTKGNYEYGAINKGHSNEICIDAVINYLRDGTALESTIRNCTDVTRFLTMRGIKGGGQWRGENLGKVARWYLSLNGEPITYIKNGNKVAGSDGARPMMVLADRLPDDIDYCAYIIKAEKLLKDLGYEKNNEKIS